MAVTLLELQEYFHQYFKSAYEDGLITFDTQQGLRVGQRKYLTRMVDNLNTSGRTRLPLADDPTEQLEIVLRPGMDPDVGAFNLFEVRWPRKRKPEKLVCFVGHRFSQEISDCLRNNLRHVLEPFNIELLWAGMDLAAVGFFEDIIRRVRESDFCVFDNRDAIDKPNVYIEMGIAYALKRPFIIAEFLGNQVPFPSDLRHVNRIAYRDYRELTRLLYFKLPRFLESEKFRQPL